MKGNCENCAKRLECKKDIGVMFGFCNTDFMPVKNTNTKRRVMTLQQVWDELSDYDKEYWKSKNVGICALVSVEDMGICKDGVTRWYTFTDENGNPAIYFKY